MQLRILQGLALGLVLIVFAATIEPTPFDSRIIEPIYTQKDSYGKNEFKSEYERVLYENIDKSFSEKDKYETFHSLQNLNPNKPFYKAEKNNWKLKYDQVEKTRLANEKKAEEKKRKAREEQEKEYAKKRRADGIYSQSQAYTRCSRELRATTNRGYYMQYSEDRMRRMMTSQLNSCMYKYGYRGN